MSAFLNMLYEQLFLKPTYPTQKHTGQTVIITGANTGLGLEAARHITRLDAEKVILAVRTTEKGETAKKSIEESTGRQGVVEVWSLDLSSYESVKQFAKKVEGLERVDALVANAGIAASKFQLTEEDESTITTNVVSTTLLAILLLPKLRESASRYNITPHLSFVSSEVHGFTPFPERNSPDIFKTLNDPEKFSMDDRYPVSKLMGLFAGRELASLSSKTSHAEVIINFTNPGLCHSELSRDGPLSLEIMKFFLARSTEVGSRNLVHAASAGVETNGMYLSSCRIAKPSPLVRSEEGARVQKRIWEEMARKFERIQPGIMGTCEIVFDLSGPGAEKVNRIYVSGNVVRQMAGRVIEECIEPGREDSGTGFVTRNFENLLSSIATPGNHFFENPPAASTFLTLLIWPHIGEHGDFSYNPGDKDDQVAEHIATTLRAAQHRYAHGSPSQRELEARTDAIEYVLPKLDDFNGHNPTWWDYYPAPDLGCGRGGEGLGNGTAVARRVERIEGVDGGGNCTGVEGQRLGSSRKRGRWRLGVRIVGE